MKAELDKRRNQNFVENILKCTWQGVIYKSRWNDESLVLGDCFSWLKRWKNVPTDVVREIFNLYTQTLQTKTFAVMRTNYQNETCDTLCRLCKSKSESVFHILNNCSILVKYSYLKRHNQVFKCFFFEIMKEFSLIDNVPPWFTSQKVSSYYGNDIAEIWWDIPEFAGSSENESEEDLKNKMRPDGKLKLKKDKKIFILEQGCPWMTNRNEVYEVKSRKYESVLRNIKLNEPEYTVTQITLVIDSLGGYSKNLRENIGKIVKDKRRINVIISKMQKAVLSESVHIARRFKLNSK